MAFISYISNNGGTMDANSIVLVTGTYTTQGSNDSKYDVFFINGQKITLIEGTDATRKEFVSYWMAPGGHLDLNSAPEAP